MKNTCGLHAYLLFALLKTQAHRELYKVPVNACDNAGDGQCARDTARPGMCNVNSNENSTLLSEPPECIACKPMVDPSKLRVDLERHIQQILILFGLIERFFEQQALQVNSVVDSAQSLDTRIDKIVSHRDLPVQQAPSSVGK